MHNLTGPTSLKAFLSPPRLVKGTMMLKIKHFLQEAVNIGLNRLFYIVFLWTIHSGSPGLKNKNGPLNLE